MVHTAISPPFSLPRQREQGENDKSPKTNPSLGLSGDAPTSGEYVQTNNAPLAQCECPVERQAGAAGAETFVAALKRKLATSHATGSFGCQYIDALTLSRALRTQVDKGDPVDVAILCMYLWMLGSSISSRDDCASSIPRAPHQVETP